MRLCYATEKLRATKVLSDIRYSVLRLTTILRTRGRVSMFPSQRPAETRRESLLLWATALSRAFFGPGTAGTYNLSHSNVVAVVEKVGAGLVGVRRHFGTNPRAWDGLPSSLPQPAGTNLPLSGDGLASLRPARTDFSWGLFYLFTTRIVFGVSTPQYPSYIEARPKTLYYTLSIG